MNFEKTFAAIILASSLTAVTFAGGPGGFDQPQPDNHAGLSFGIDAGLNAMANGKKTYGSQPKVGLGLSGNLDYTFPQNFRIGLSFHYMRNNLEDNNFMGISDKTNINQFAILANGYFDFAMGGGPLVPYVGAGVGYDSISINDSLDGFEIPDGEKDAGSFAWSATAGLNYFVNDTLAIDLGYRMISATPAHDPIYNNLITAGISFHIG